MWDLLFKVWWMIAVMPFIIFQEATARFAAFLKQHDIYPHWDTWHSLLVVLVAILIVMVVSGYY